MKGYKNGKDNEQNKVIKVENFINTLCHSWKIDEVKLIDFEYSVKGV